MAVPTAQQYERRQLAVGSEDIRQLPKCAAHGAALTAPGLELSVELGLFPCARLLSSTSTLVSHFPTAE